MELLLFLFLWERFHREKSTTPSHRGGTAHTMNQAMNVGAEIEAAAMRAGNEVSARRTVPNAQRLEATSCRVERRVTLSDRVND